MRWSRDPHAGIGAAISVVHCAAHAKRWCGCVNATEVCVLFMQLWLVHVVRYKIAGGWSTLSWLLASPHKTVTRNSICEAMTLFFHYVVLHRTVEDIDVSKSGAKTPSRIRSECYNGCDCQLSSSDCIC